MIAFLVILLIICIFLSAFFSASEMSYSSCNQLRLENLIEKGNKNAKRALSICERFEDALGAILIGNNLVNIAASSIGSVLVIKIFESDSYAWVSTLIITVLVIIFGETIPKIIAKKRANSFALSFSWPIKALTVIFSPLIKLCVFLINCFTKNMEGEDDVLDEEEAIDEAIDELQSIIETAEDEEVLDEDQSELVQNAIDFLDIQAVEVMTSRVDLVAIDLEDDSEKINQTIMDSSFTRLPVYKGSLDEIIGILHINQYLKAKVADDSIEITDLLMKPVYVYKTTLLTSVLDQLRSAKQHLAIVCDEYGGTIGIVTMEDILEEIVGDIWDESDVIEEDVKKISSSSFEVDGDMTISDFCELLEIDEEDFECESETVGGWALEHFETYPNANEGFEDENIKVTILGIEERRITKLLIEKISE